MAARKPDASKLQRMKASYTRGARTCWESPVTRGWRRMKSSVLSSRPVGLEPALARMRRARPLGCSSRHLNRCSVSTICWLDCAPASTRWREQTAYCSSGVVFLSIMYQSEQHASTL